MADPTAQIDGRSYKLFFVRGHMRSGTNWLANVLNLHPRINVQGEFHLEILYKAYQHFTTASWSMGSHEPIKTMARESFDRLVRQAMLTVAEKKPEAAWIGDRTPAPVHPFLPDARHIIIMRDGRDVLVSWTFHQLRIGGPFNEPHRTNLTALREKFKEDPTYFDEHPEELLTDEAWVRDVAWGWSCYMRDHQEVLDQIDKGEVTGRVCQVRYEDLHADPEGERAKLYRFLDLDPAQAEELSEKNKTTAGFSRKDPMSFFRAGRVGDWQTYRNGRFERWFEDVAGEHLRHLGYEPSGVRAQA